MRSRFPGGGTFRRAFMAVLLGAVCSAPASAHAPILKTLYDFCTKGICTGGGSGLMMDKAGSLFGTSQRGGVHGLGAAYGLLVELGQQKRKFQVLYNFCARNGCTDGRIPEGNLIVDTAGNLYGTAAAGGLGDDTGVVFKLSPDPNRKQWTYSVIYNFCYTHNSCSDGFQPQLGLTYQGAASGAPYDGVSPLYGATIGGGGHQLGVVFSLTPTSTPGKWHETTLYAFCREGGSTCTDGSRPTSLAVEADGNLIGEAAQGGTNGNGVVFRLTPQAGMTKWTEAVLYRFCTLSNCSDGSDPAGAIVEDSSGNILGTTYAGGSSRFCQQVCGVAFRIAPDGTESVLHNFCSHRICEDGENPVGGLVANAKGKLLGTTLFGGMQQNPGGTVFEINGSSFRVLYRFCSEAACADGAEPAGNVVVDGAGHLFGATELGGAAKQGTVYEVRP